MAILAHKREQEALHKQNQELSLEAQVFLAFKRRSKNRYELLDQLTRANVILEKQLTNKTRLLHPKARTIAEKILNKLARTGVEEAILTHKQLHIITRCLADQNRILIHQLSRLFIFEYKRKYLKYKRCYVFQIHSIIKEIADISGKRKEVYND